MMKRFLIILVMLFWCNVGVANELIKIPVHVHILEIDEKGYKTKTKPEHIEVHFRKANEIWAKANIFWNVKKIDYVPANTSDFKSNVKWLRKHPINKKNAKKQDIIERRAEIIDKLLQIEFFQKLGVMNVYYMPYLFSGVCAFTRWFEIPYPSRELLVIGHTIDPKLKSKEKCEIPGIILAHELGHMVHLKHIMKSGHLMGKYGGTKIPKKTAIEARENYKKHIEKYMLP